MSLGPREQSHEHAEALVRAGMLEEAIGLYRDLQAQDWRDLRALTALRELFERMERLPELAEQLSILARNRLESGQLEEAVEAMQKAVELDRRRPGLHLRLALVLLRAGRVEEARYSFYEAAYRSLRAGREQDARRILARSLQACGHPYAAVKRLVDAERRGEPLDEGERRHLYRCLGWPADGSSRGRRTIH
jgi:tetratricopeptide (TPR) repeat protein